MTEIVERGDEAALRAALEADGWGGTIYSKADDEYTLNEVARAMQVSYQTARRRMAMLVEAGRWERRSVLVKGGETFLFRRAA